MAATPQPAKPCRVPECHRLRPCPEPGHEPAAWEGSRRRERVRLSGSAEQKRARRILRRFDRICHVCELPGADEVDHVVPLAEGGADDDSNLRPIHSFPCHRDKTQAEAQRARIGKR